MKKKYCLIDLKTEEGLYKYNNFIHNKTLLCFIKTSTYYFFIDVLNNSYVNLKVLFFNKDLNLDS